MSTSDKLAAWRAAAEKEIKRDPDTLVWNTLEGIPVKPLYTAEDLAGCRAEEVAPIAVTYRGHEVRQTPPNSTSLGARATS